MVSLLSKKLFKPWVNPFKGTKGCWKRRFEMKGVLRRKAPFFKKEGAPQKVVKPLPTQLGKGQFLKVN